MAIHQNEEGEVLFEDGSIYTPANQTIRPLVTTLPFPRVQAASGNFAIIVGHIDGYPYTETLNTTTNISYSVSACNGPRLTALSSTMAAIDDCSAEVLMDMTDGTRSDIG